MADEILKALQASSYSPMDSMYGIGASTIAGAIPGLVDPNASVGSNAGYTAGAGILAALFAGLAKNSANSDNATLLPLKNELLNPNTTPQRQAEIAASNTKLNPIYQALQQQNYDSALKARDAVSVANALVPNKMAEEQRAQGYAAQNADALATNQLLAPDGKVYLRGTNQITSVTDPIAREVDKATRLAQANKSVEDAGNPLAGVPKELRTEVTKELGYAQKQQNSFDFIDKAFEKSKELVGDDAYYDGSWSGRPSAKGAALAGLKDSIILQIDNSLGAEGREINSDVRDRLMSLTPRWNDTEEDIDNKKDAMKALLTSVSKPTPITDSLRDAVMTNQQQQTATTDTTQVPAGMELKTLPNGQQVYVPLE